MIEAAEFVTPAQHLGLARYAGVPCSFLTPLLDHVIDDAGLPCLTAANEGEAVAAMAGAALGGHPGIAMMQNSGLGNAVSPLTSLAWVFRLPVLLVVTWRGAPDLQDEPQHELMGRITGTLLDTMQIPWQPFPDHPATVVPTLQIACHYLRSERRPCALLMRKGVIAPRPSRTVRTSRPGLHVPPPTGERSDPARWPTRAEALRRVIEQTPPESGTVVIATTGYTGRELFALADRPNHFYMVGSMGCATALGLGLSQARPDLRVVVIDGDGAALMRMGTFATIGSQAGGNLIHLLLDNQMHESTGGQPTVSSRVHFAPVAAACGYPYAVESDRVDAIDTLLNAGDPVPPPGPRFLHLRIRPGIADRLPRPDLSPVQVKERLMSHIGATPWSLS